MKVYAKIAFLLFIAACTKGASPSQEGTSPESMHEQEKPSDPSSRDQVPESSKTSTEDSNTGQTPVMDQNVPTETTMPGQGNSPPPPTNTVNQTPVEFGVLNFRQYLSTLSSLTGVSLHAPAAAGGVAPMAEYMRAYSSLPRNNSIYNFTSVHVVSMTRLSSVYCDVLANNTALLEAKFPGLSLIDVPSDSLAFARTLVTAFYGPETTLQAPRATDIAAVAAAVDSLKTLPEATGAAIFVATCAALMSAAEIGLH